jgi:hypothetical protein
VQEITLWQRASAAGRQDADPQRRTGAAQTDDSIRVTTRGYRHPTRGKITQRELTLLIARRHIRLIGPDPHLDEVHRFNRASGIDSVRIVALGVHDPGTRTHSLREPGIDESRMAVRILVNQ